MSEKHLKNCRSVKSSNSLVQSFSQATTSKNKVKKGEIRLASFIAEHNISIETSDHLVELIKSVCPDSKIAKNMSCNRSKCTALINNVIGKSEFEELVTLMQNNKFSIIVDESTNRTSEKHLAVVVRTCTDDLNICDDFLALLEVTDGTALGLYKLLTQFFNDNGIPYKSNLLGFAADGTNTMMGAKQSLQSLLKQDVPNLFIMKCVCHSLALCASYACEKIPKDVDNLIRNIYNYFKSSPKRQNEFKEFQKFVEMKPHKLLRPCQTRWLSLLACVERVLEQYPALYSICSRRIPEQGVAFTQKYTHRTTGKDQSSTVSFWKEVKKTKKGDDMEAFPNLNSFVAQIFTLPHSSACVERVFSAVNLNKTKTRNRLRTKTLTGLLHKKTLLRQKTRAASTLKSTTKC
ncbi:uncharacterized protein LOC120350252 [Nilaparvata lugens]|uniref:uncharacterized protein LOC120350252 n=1 Tax=Nilaparvata lugens TaxID=108931 RepID=UPI00193C9BFA|nr:uncharacterized protein LOC120350252 [Nilaparvata lugens]